MLQPIGHNWRVFVQMQVGGQKYFERSGGAIRSSRVDQHVVQRSTAIGRVDIFHLCHPDRIECGRENGLGKSVCGLSYKTAILKSKPYREATEKPSATLSFQANATHVSILPIAGLFKPSE